MSHKKQKWWTIGDVVDRLRQFPSPVIREATSGAHDLEDALWYEGGCYVCGEQLMLLAGLAACALYSERILDTSDPFPVDALFHDYLRTLLFRRGYDTGIACSIIQRSGALQTPPFDGVIDDDRPIVSFVMARPKNPGNLVRSQLHCRPEAQLCQLVDHLRFLCRFEFSTDASGVIFSGKPIELMPFLWWNGERLWRYNHLSMGKEPVLTYVSFAGGEPEKITKRVDVILRDRIRQLAHMLEVQFPEHDEDQVYPLQSTSQSLIPLFADSYPSMNRLAQKVFSLTEETTRYDLWVKPTLQSDFNDMDLDFGLAGNSEAWQKVKDEVFVTNAIIKQFMDTDPVSVLEKYLVREENDQRSYFDWLTGDADKVNRLTNEINEDVRLFQNRMSAWYFGMDKREQLNRQLHAYRARRVAQKIIQLMGFPIIEQSQHMGGIDDYLHNVKRFYEYLQSGGKDPGQISVTLFECSKIAEELLHLLISFYTALRYYSIEEAEGLNGAAIERHQKDSRQIKTSGLGRLISLFHELGNDADLKQELIRHLGRDSIWPDKSHKDHFTTLNILRDTFRNKQAHIPGANAPKNAKEMVKRFLLFLEWLKRPMECNAQEWPIFPAILTLNVITTNSCRITSVKYKLTQQDDHSEEITLYTKQPLSVTSGVFYGMPRSNKVIAGLWVDPVLIPMKLLIDKEGNNETATV